MTAKKSHNMVWNGDTTTGLAEVPLSYDFLWKILSKLCGSAKFYGDAGFGCQILNLKSKTAKYYPFLV